MTEIILILAFIGIYFYLSDAFRSPKVKEKIQNFIKSDNQTSHSILEYLDTASNSLAGVTSFTSVAIINQLPVSSKILIRIILYNYFLLLPFF